MYKSLSLFIGTVVFILGIGCKQETKSPEQEQKTEAVSAEVSGNSDTKKTIVFFGNSLTAGYGLDPTEAFPALIQRKIDSLQLPYTVVNAGVSGETSSGGSSRIDWILRQPIDVFILELGGNDGLRGIPVDETRKNLQSIIDKVREKNPQTKIIITGMQMPPSMGPEYTRAFRNLYPDLAKINNLAFVPFLLEGVGGIEELNQRDGIHPTAEGQKIVADNVWKELHPLL